MLRVLLTGILLLGNGAAHALPAPLFASLSWRFIGPYRGGRVDAVAGVAGKLNLAYFGSVDGGVFKTTDAGVTWQPMFQHEPVASIGAIGVAASNPNIIYVGTGESTIRTDASYGDGVYRSDDAGKHWRHVGLDDSQRIGRLLVDSKNPERVLVAVLGHVWGPNSERGVFLTADGGRHWEKTLYVNDSTGAVDLARDRAHPESVYATTWSPVRPPWFQYQTIDGPGSAIYHSADSGRTWHKLAMHGLPADMGRIGIAVADTRSGPRLYAVVSAGGGFVSATQRRNASNLSGKGSGIYRSDDGGATWRLVNSDPRLSGRGWYFGRIYADPQNPDVVYVPNTSLYRSADGGKHFTAIKGSPDGDDMHALWIDSRDPSHLILGTDQGTSLSLDGEHWSSWYNQPTAQIYHISVDDQVPFNIYGPQQDSGALMITSRGHTGIITNRDWHPIGGGESGYVFPRPGDPSILYDSSSMGVISIYNTQTYVTTKISPKGNTRFGVKPSANLKYYPWNTALAVSPFDPDTLYVGAQVVLETRDAGKHWQAISPILTYKRQDAHCVGMPTRATAAACGYSVIYALAPSPADKGVIWAGTDDGRLWRTPDGGKHWLNVTPAHLGAWSRVDAIEADPHDAASAYVAVDRHEVDDLAPYIYITHDAGEHWREATQGIPYGDYVRVVRADPDRKGLLYAGTEEGVFVSFDDGGAWQPLQLNLPTTSVHDLRVHAGDLIAATHGRGIWILDDIEPLREASVNIADSAVHLFAPLPAVRFLPGTWYGEARPPEVPHAANPPDGAIIDYWLAKGINKPVALAIYDAQGKIVRRYSSAVKPAQMPPANFPDYFKSPPNIPPAKAGTNRFVWDLRGTPHAGQPYWAQPPVLHRTPRGPLGNLVSPGQYRVVFTVDGKNYSAPLTVLAAPSIGNTPVAGGDQSN